ncbi:MAG: DUF1853 family protein [Betaproteobacteria bacterium]|nr:DUF1853 family protein [Betaproteobacteria bacterium]
MRPLFTSPGTVVPPAPPGAACESTRRADRGLAAGAGPEAESILRRLTQPDVRALAALVATPSLIGTEAPVALLEDRWRWDCLAGRRRWLEALDAAPAPLAEHVSRSNGRQLGRYAEALWQFWFAHLPGARVHAAGLSVKDGGVVRGEFDFIVSLPDLPGVSHLETGYKFFLYCPPGADASRCVGPDPFDRLDRKWRHMLDAQLPLSQTPLGRAAMPPGVDPATVIPRACLQGYVFYPFDTPDPMLATLAPGHARGHWCRFGAAPRWADRAARWVTLDKRAWIAPAWLPPATAGSRAEPLTATEAQACLERHFAASRQAQLLAGLARDADGGWRETVRVFVVAPDWRGADAGEI